MSTTPRYDAMLALPESLDLARRHERTLAMLLEAEQDLTAIRARMRAMLPLFQEARDALTALTIPQCKLHGIDMFLADRMDDVGIATRWNKRALAEDERK